MTNTKMTNTNSDMNPAHGKLKGAKWVKSAATFLTYLGAINLGLVGVNGYNFIEGWFHPMIARASYLFMGMAGIYLLGIAIAEMLDNSVSSRIK
jgi:uncharacterized membrane protein YuzA (DUF378 family)